MSEEDEYAPITPKIKNAVAWMCAFHEVQGQYDAEWIDESELVETRRRFDEAMEPLTEDERDTAEYIYWGTYTPPCAVSNFRVQHGIWGEEPYWSAEVEDAMGRKAYTLLKG